MVQKGIILFFFLSIVLCSTAIAQWQQLFTFPAEPRVTYFIDLPGERPRIGFVGLQNGELWKTIDGGGSWGRVSKPTADHPIVSITFKDSLFGWYCTKPEATAGRTAVYMTNDGGWTWFPTLLMDSAFSAVYYNAAIDRLLVSTWNNAYFYSDDIANSFKLDLSYYLNGYAFLNDKDGIATPLGYPTGPPAIVTTDGGTNWTISNLRQECWQPLAVKGSNTYYAINEHTGYVFRSDDRGYNWRQISRVPYGLPTGHIAGDFCRLVVQTDVAGVLISTDEGYNWISIGGPNAWFDVRFYLKDQYLYATSQDAIHRIDLDKITKRSALIVQPQVQIDQSSCAPVDSVIRLTYLHSCYSNQARIKEINLRGSSNFSISKPIVIPKLLLATDSFSIRYGSLSHTPDTAYVDIKIDALDSTFDTTITIIGGFVEDNIHEWTKLPDDSLSLSTAKCRDHDTTLVIGFRDSCSRATLTSVYIEGSENFSLVGAPKTPHLINNPDKFKVQYSPSGTGSDTARIHLQLDANGTIIDTVITVYASSLNDTLTTWTKIPEDSLTLTTENCTGTSGVFYLSFKDSCSRATLDSITLHDPSHFTLIDEGALPRLVSLTDSFAIAYEPSGSKADSTLITLHLSADGKSYDTTLYVKVSNRLERLALWTILPPDSTTLVATECLIVDTTLYFYPKDLCSYAVLDSIVPGNQSEFTYYNLGTLPRVIHGKDSLSIRFQPTKYGTVTSSFEMRLQGNDDIYHKTFYVTATLKNDTVRKLPQVHPLQVGMLSPTCSYFDTTIYYGYKVACSEATLVSATIEGSSTFTLDSSLTFPRQISELDSIQVRFSPQGTSNEEAQLRLTFMIEGRLKDTVLDLSGDVADIYRLRWPVIQTRNGLKADTVTTGSLAGISVLTSQDIPEEMHLDSMRFRLLFNDNAFTFARAFTSPAWKILDTIYKQGVLDVKLERAQNGYLGKDSLIFGAMFSTTVSDSAATSVSLERVVFNNIDSGSSPCYFAEPDGVRYDLLPLCADSIIRGFMRGETMLKLLGIVPNPTSSSATTNVKFELELAAPVTIALSNSVGQTVFSQTTETLSVGTHSVPIILGSLPSGSYILSLRCQGIVVSSKLTVQD